MSTKGMVKGMEPNTQRRHRLGLRCEAMVLLGLVWLIMAMGVEFGASRPPEGLVFTLVPSPVRAAIWAGTGLYAIWTAIQSRGTSRALAMMNIMPLVRLISYLLSWLLWLLPWEFDALAEYEHGWYQAGFYAAMIGFVVFAAHIPPGLLRSRPSPDRERCPQS